MRIGETNSESYTTRHMERRLIEVLRRLNGAAF
jgi:hypothetical protein